MEPASDISTILSGCTVYVEVRTDMEDISRSVAKHLRALGADVSHTLKKEVTHIVYRYGTKKTREWAEKRGIPLVTVSWISACREYKTRMPEGFYRVKLDPPSPVDPLEPWKKKKKPRCRFMQPLSPEEEERRSAKKIKRKQRLAERNALKQKIVDADKQIKCREELDQYLASGGEIPTDRLVDFYRLYYAKAKIYVPPTPPAMVAFRERQERKARGEKVDSLSSSDDSQGDGPSRSSVRQFSTLSSLPDTTTDASSTRPFSSSISMSAVCPTPDQPSTSGMPNYAQKHSSQNNRTSSSDESNQSWRVLLSPTPDHSPSRNHSNEDKRSPAKSESGDYPASTSSNIFSRRKRIYPVDISSQKAPSTSMVYAPDSDNDSNMDIAISSRSFANLRFSLDSSTNHESASDMDVTESVDSGDLNTFFKPSPIYPSQMPENDENLPGSNSDRGRNSSETLRHEPFTADGSSPSQSNHTPVFPRSESPLFLPTFGSGSEETRDEASAETREESSADCLWSQVSDNNDVNLREETNDRITATMPSNTALSHHNDSAKIVSKPLKGKKTISKRQSKTTFPIIDMRPWKYTSDDEDSVTTGEIEVYALPNSLIRRKITTLSNDVRSPQPISTQVGGNLTVDRGMNTVVTNLTTQQTNNNSGKDSENKAPRDSLEDFWLEKTFTMDRLQRLKARKMKSKSRSKDHSSSKKNTSSSATKSQTLTVQPTDSITAPGCVPDVEYVISITSLHSNERADVCSAIRTLKHARLVDGMSPDVTHLIGNDGPVRRTLNLLLALVTTEPPCHIVTLEWVRESIRQNRWVDADPYQVGDCLTLEGIRVSRRLFQEYDYFYVAEHVSPPRPQLIKIIEGCGGKVIQSFRQAGILIGAKRPNAITVEPKWIFDSIMATEVLPVENYLSNS